MRPPDCELFGVLRDASSSAWLWLEYRQPAGEVDGALRYLGNSERSSGGLLVHYGIRCSTCPTRDLLDFSAQASPTIFVTEHCRWKKLVGPLHRVDD